MFEHILNVTSGIGTVSPPAGVPTDTGSVSTLISTVITLVYSLAGVAAFAFLIVGGYKYMSSAGDAQKVKEAQDTLAYAVGGLVLVLITGMIINFIGDKLGVKSLITVLQFPGT